MNEKYGGGKADAYLSFLRNTLKPHIDASFRTFPGSENTTIMGSSLGGLVSFYALLKYPETFGQAGVSLLPSGSMKRSSALQKVRKSIPGTDSTF